MEVAGQWRRQWAGTAEYGKVTEGGVTRQVARAMEVLHASGPGAAVRVVRAAYHSSAGPGAPASSYLVHSSRRVFSSGFNFLEPPTFPSKPLEISSTPFESNENTNENTKYKVTEPDDTEISEPSKWRGSTVGNSIRLPSEESSSTADNASVIDLDWRSKTSPRKSSCDSESSELQFPKRNSIDIPIQISPPETLRTLKYKSLLNNNNDWNDRRQSYSFEDTSPVNETVLHANDTLAMESSTDSGICKSSELLNEPGSHKYSLKSNEDTYNSKDISFKDWLSRNRNYPSRSTVNVELETKQENNIALRSSGKVSIVPITIEKDEPFNSKSEDVDRKIKRVEFCKTELHFAAESGKVNIIATDEKPPPSNDFRKRRSAFVPLNENFERPVTLFGEKSTNNSLPNNNTINTSHNYELTEHFENTAATKSILKNKIPKPKPYLLGENMEFGRLDNVTTKDNNPEDSVVSSAVLLINKQLQEGRMNNEDIRTDVPTDYGKFNKDFNTKRTLNTGSIRNEITNYHSTNVNTKRTDERKLSRSPSPRKNNIKIPQNSPVPTRSKSRPLRECELMYFGADQKENVRNQNQRYAETKLPSQRVDEFKSVKLIQKVSNSVGNSDNESESLPEYQNLPINKFTPIPAPRTSILLEKPREVVEEECIKKKAYETRRSRFRNQENGSLPRSISEPPKRNSLEKNNNRSNKDSSSNNPRLRNGHAHRDGNEIIHEIEDQYSDGHSSPTYVNLPAKDLLDQIVATPEAPRRKASTDANTLVSKRNSSPRQVKSKNNQINISEKSTTVKESEKFKNHHSPERHSVRTSRNRTEKLQTPEITNEIKEFNRSITRNGRKKEESARSLKKGREESIPVAKQREHRDKRSKSCNNQKDSLRSFSNKNYSRMSEADKNTTDDYTKSSNSESVKKYSKFNNKHMTDKKDDSLSKNKHSHTHDKTASTKGYDTKVDKHRSYRKSEYVINYDDKDGTVSSVCKMRPNSSSSKKTKIHKDGKETPIASDRISLLQLPDRDWIQNDYSHVDRRSYRKIRMQRTCQLL